MNKSILLAFLTATAFLPAIPSATAEPLLCVNDLCIDAPGCDGSEGDCVPTCASKHGAGVVFWYFMLPTLGVRDLPAPGTYYAASWSSSTYYEWSGSGCREVAYSCRVQVSDGSHFQYLRVGTASAANGEYKGVPTSGGTLACAPCSVTLHTRVLGVLQLDGYGSCNPIIED